MKTGSNLALLLKRGVFHQSATGHISGGHLNPVVTFAALPGGKISLEDAMLYWLSQLEGASIAGFACMAIFSQDVDIAGTSQLSEGIPPVAGMAVEAIL